MFLAIAAVNVLTATGAVTVNSLAAAGDPVPGLSVVGEIVDSTDQIMNCEGPKFPGGSWNCGVRDSALIKHSLVKLPPVKVTDDVLGCTKGSQPSIARIVTYQYGTQIGASASISLKILPGLSEVFKEIGPQIGVSYATTTTFGQGQTQSIPADYGMISWGIFAQDAVESELHMTVLVNDTHISSGVAGLRYYTARNVRTFTPVVEETTKFPRGSFGKESRPFASADEFRKLCGPGAPLPPSLGGPPPPPPEAPSPPPSETPPPPATEVTLATLDAFEEVLDDGVGAGAITSAAGLDLRGIVANVRTALVDGATNLPDQIANLRRKVGEMEREGSISTEYAGKLHTVLNPTA